MFEVESSRRQRFAIEDLPKHWTLLSAKFMRFIWIRDWESRSPDSFKPFETKGYMVASAPHGGIVVTYKLMKPPAFSRRINIFSGALEYITTIKLAVAPRQWSDTSDNPDWYTCCPVSFIGITSDEIIVVLMANCTVLLFTVTGMLLTFIKLKDEQGEDMKQISPPMITKLRGRSLAVITREQDFLFIRDIRNPVWAVSTRQDRGNSFVSIAVNNAVDFDFICLSSGFHRDRPIIWAVGVKGDLTVNRGSESKEIAKGLTVAKVSVSPSGQQIAFLTYGEKATGEFYCSVIFESMGDVGKNSVTVRFDINDPFAESIVSANVVEFVWCGESAVALIYDAHAVFVNKFGEMYYIDDLVKPVVAVPEVDGLRLIYKSPLDKFGHHKFVSYVSSDLGMMFKNGSEEKRLLDFYLNWANGEGKDQEWASDESINTLRKLYNAAKELTYPECQELLNIIRCGSCTLDPSDMPDLSGGDEGLFQMNNTKFEIVECVRRELQHKILITVAELEACGAKTFLTMLCNRGLYKAVTRFAQMLAYDMVTFRTHEAITYVVTQMQKGESIVDLKGFEQDSAVNFAMVANAAYFLGASVDRKPTFEMIEKLLEMDKKGRRSIPVYTLMGQYEKAMKLASSWADAASSRWVVKQAISHGREDHVMNDEAYDIKDNISDFDKSPLDVLLFRLKCLDQRNLVAFLSHILNSDKKVDAKVFQLMRERLSKMKAHFDVACLKRLEEITLHKNVLLKDVEPLEEEEKAEEADEDGDETESHQESEGKKPEKHKKPKHKKSDQAPPPRQEEAPSKPTTPRQDQNKKENVDDEEPWNSDQHKSRTILEYLEYLILEGQDEKAASEAKRFLVADERFVWLKFRTYVTNRLGKKIMDMRTEISKISGLPAFILCVENNLIEAAAAIVDFISDPQDKQQAVTILTRVVRNSTS